MKTIILIFALAIGATSFAQQPQTKYYENGQVKMELTKVGDRVLQTMFYQSGEIKQVGTFHNGKPCGIWKTYDKTGDILSEGYYENGVKTGKWIVKADRKATTYEINYVNGKRVEALALN
ncbi:MAG: hypothetical protein N4A46_10660 [Schleiferiaceae bacterium]|jgi:antitoxin component YwqK of YwqJK toxin-antitoxin module|nr:hypothetical protein [Schleiferiaceae bacterium]